MNFVVVDASVWVARLVPKDIFHSPVRLWINHLRSEGTELIAPSLILVEVAGVISRRTGSAQLAKRAAIQLQSLPGFRLVEMDNLLLQKAAQLAAELGLRGADSIYVAVASHLEVPLVTLDEDQRTRSKKKVEVLPISHG